MAGKALAIRLGLDTSDFQKGINVAKRRLTAFFGKDVMKGSDELLSKLKYVAAGITALGIKSIITSANFEMTRRSITALIGDSEKANQHLQKLQQFAATTPFDFTQTVEASKKLQAYGLAADNVIPVLRALGDANTAVGGNQETLDQMTLAIGQMMAKGKLASEELTRQLGQVIPAWKLIADQMGISVAELMKRVSKGSVDATTGLTALFEGINKKYGGMMQQMSGEIPQLFSNMKDSIGFIMRDIGSEIIDGLNLKSRFQEISDWLAAFASVLHNSGIKEAFSQLVPDNIKGEIVGIAIAVAGMLVPALAKLAVVILGITGPFGIVVAASGVAVAMIASQWDSIEGFFTNLWDSVKAICEGGANIVLQTIRKVGSYFGVLSETTKNGLDETIKNYSADWDARYAKTLSKLPAVKGQEQRFQIEKGTTTPKINNGSLGFYERVVKPMVDKINKEFQQKPVDFSKAFAGLSTGFGGGKKGKSTKTASGLSAVDTFVGSIRDQMKYLGVDGASFLGVLDQWLSRSKPLTKDWKTLRDLQLEITNAARETQISDAKARADSKTKAEEDAKALKEMKANGQSAWLSNINWKNQQGLVSNGDAFTQVSAKFQQMKSDLAGQIGTDFAEDPDKWTAPMREFFASLQDIGSSDASKALDTLKSQFENGTISASEYRTQIEAIAEQYGNLPVVSKLGQDAITNLNLTIQNSTSAALQSRTAWQDAKSAIANAPSQIGDAFMEAIKGSKSLSESFLGLLQDIGAVIAKGLIMRTLFGGGEGGGFFGSGGGLFGLLGLKFHSGGVVGEGGSPALVSPSIFAGAPRMHAGGLAGLRADEVPAILQKGETVIPRGGASLGGDSAGNTYNITIQANDAKSFNDMLTRSKGTLEGLISNGIQRGGSLARAVKGASA